MANAGVRRDDFEILERGLAPAEKGVALDVALKFELGVEAKGVGVAEFVDLHGVVDDQLGGEERIDARGIGAHPLDGFAPGGEVDDGGDPGEILEEHARRPEGGFFLRAVWSSSGHETHVVAAYRAA